MIPWFLLACAPALPPEPVPVAEVPEVAPEPAPETPPEPAPAFHSSVSPLPDELIARMKGTSYRDGCPTPLADLRVLSVTHHGFDGQVHTGELVVHEYAAPVVQRAFEAAFETGFAIRLVRPVSQFDGSDDKSMAADNTSAFNCRTIKGTQTWSEHSTGKAIDINPRENPWVRGSSVDPPEGADFVDRSAPQPGLLTEDHPVTRAFLEAGWGWGGHWTKLKDYQHFSESGR